MDSSKNHDVIDDNIVRKAKHNKKETSCYVKRNSDGCGICGSLNVAIQGVRYCGICGKEVPFLEFNRFFNYMVRSDDYKHNPKCNCIKIYTYKKGGFPKIEKYRDIKTISVGKCMDCGAVMSSFCPNGKSHSCWRKENKYFCKTCGYRI